MSKLDVAIKKHMEHIVKAEGRPFCVLDFDYFEVDGEFYHVDCGTFRNKICEWKEKGEVLLQYRSMYSYYSIPGYDFNISTQMTKDHAGLPLKIIKQTPIYQWLVKQPTEKQALHNFRLTFKTRGIWNCFSKTFPTLVNKSSKDIILTKWKFIDEVDVYVTIHHSDTVSIAIACSLRPIAIDVPDLFYLIELLTRTEIKIASYCYDQNESQLAQMIPRYTTWIVKMWHFGIDITSEYNDKEFQVTVREGLSDMWRIYTKRGKDKKFHPRVERQEYPDIEITDAILDKIYTKGINNDV